MAVSVHRRGQSGLIRASIGVACLVAATVVATPPAYAGPCDPPINPIVCENSQPGTPQSVWDVVGSGSSTIQGFATDISVNVGATESFKIKTDATSYTVDIYRMGYYGGDGARLIAQNIPLSATLPQPQPACIVKPTTYLIDCGNWGVSDSWNVPTTAVSGIYFARLTRTDSTAGASLIVFIVRDDSSTSDILFQTSDTTWEAYNRYGGRSLYYPSYPPSSSKRTKKVSYDRPFVNRDCCAKDFVFNAEYPMVRWLEANGYDVSYFTGVDAARNGILIQNHTVYMSVGHDEYWSGDQRANIGTALAGKTNLAFFSGNEVYWKTRWEASVAGPTIKFRTLVTYKETFANAKIDPSSQWTGTWADPRFSPPADGGQPQNQLTGTFFTVIDPRADSITVPASYGALRFWRDTSVASLAPGETATFPAGTLGFEWDSDLDNGFRPPGLYDLSSTAVSGVPILRNWGLNFTTGTATHSPTMYRAPSGALVFGAGTIQWSWGLDPVHDTAIVPTSGAMRQATVNLLADMDNVQPDTLQSDLVAATESTDGAAPTLSFDTYTLSKAPPTGQQLSVSGAASDAGGGVVAGVEVSTDGGLSWHPASGRSSWSYTWAPQQLGLATVEARAVDDSGNLETTVSGLMIDVQPRACPCSIWKSSDTPGTTSAQRRGTELGLRFSPRTSGSITGLRFYKGSGNVGPHVGALYGNGGALLAQVTFTGETSRGWQSASFSSPVPVATGMTYVVAYFAPKGHYSVDDWTFGRSGLESWPLSVPEDWMPRRNGVYSYSTVPTFPKTGSNSTNYWVDPVFVPTSPTVTLRSPSPGATDVPVNSIVIATFDSGVKPDSIDFTLTGPDGSMPATESYDGLSRTATLSPSSPLVPTTSYTASVFATGTNGAPMPNADTWSFTTAAPVSSSLLALRSLRLL